MENRVVIYSRHPAEKIAVPNALCRACKNICVTAQALRAPFEKDKNEDFSYEEIPDKVFAHYDCLQDLKESAHSGCHLCTLLLGSFQTQPENFMSTEKLEAFRQEPMTVRLWYFLRGCGYNHYNFVMDLHIENLREYPTLKIGYLVIQADPWLPVDTSVDLAESRFTFSTGAHSTIKLAQKWLSDCRSSHSKCKRTSNSAPFLPTRLIDVQRKANDDSLLNLVTVDAESEELLDYVTLSHCWGKLDMFTLRSTTINRMIAGFDINEIPKTFRDAVHTCRELGFQYLWIDALCIIQDSVADWERESMRMGSVYDHSALTIGALCGTDSHAGFINTRNPLEHHSCLLTENGDTQIYASPAALARELRDESGLNRGSPAALHTRAWVVQERLIAPRTLYFGSRMISWECRESIWSESSKRSILNANAPNISPKYLFQALRQPLSPLASPADFIAFYDAWTPFLELYTAGRLTYESDRLFALAGVIEIVRLSTAFTSICGLWKELLHAELLWRRCYDNYDTHSIPNPKVDRAPSWSWASQDGPVKMLFRRVGEPFDPNVVFLTRKPSVEQPPFCGNHPYLMICGYLIEPGLLKMVEEEEYDGEYRLFKSKESHQAKVVQTTRFYPDNILNIQDATKLNAYFFLVARNTDRRTDYGLALTRLSDGKFKRIGVFLDINHNNGVNGMRVFNGEEEDHEITII